MAAGTARYASLDEDRHTYLPSVRLWSCWHATLPLCSEGAEWASQEV